jgi:hypothetical protein
VEEVASPYLMWKEKGFQVRSRGSTTPALPLDKLLDILRTKPLCPHFLCLYRWTLHLCRVVSSPGTPTALQRAATSSPPRPAPSSKLVSAGAAGAGSAVAAWTAWSSWVACCMSRLHSTPES